MGALEQLSVQRAHLPKFGGPNASLAEQMVIGEQQARARLLKHTTQIRYAPAVADAVVFKISSWAQTNRVVLEQLMANPTVQTVPEALALEFGPESAAQFIIAGYSNAVRGMGPWTGGGVFSAVKTGAFGITEPWAAQDANARVLVFQTIVKMDDDGDLGRIFRGEPMAGVGAIFTTGLITGLVIIAAITLVALVYVLNVSAETARVNNRILEKNCEWAREHEDKALIAKCSEYAQQAAITVPGLDQLLKPLAMIGIAYVGVIFGVPAIMQAMSDTKRRRERAA